MNGSTSARAGGRALAAGISAVLVAGMVVVAGALPAAAATLASSFNVVAVGGTGATGNAGDGGPAFQAQLGGAGPVAADAAGDLAVATTTAGVSEVRLVAGTSRTAFGQSMTAGDVYTLVQSSSGLHVTGLAFEPASGDLLVSSNNPDELDVVSEATGNLAISAGTAATPSGSPATGATPTASPVNPAGVTVDPATGDVVFADGGAPGDPAAIRFVAESTTPFFGVGSPAVGKLYTVTSGTLAGIDGLALDTANGALVFSLTGTDVVELDAPTSGTYFGVAATADVPVAVAGRAGTANTTHDVTGTTENGAPATAGLLTAPRGVAVDPTGNLLVADTGDAAVRAVASATGKSSIDGVQPAGGTVAGDVYTIAGTGTSGTPTLYAAATTSELTTPDSVAVLGTHPLVSDAGANRLFELGAPSAPTAAPSGVAVTEPTAGHYTVTWDPVPPPAQGYSEPLHYAVSEFTCTSPTTCTLFGTATTSTGTQTSLTLALTAPHRQFGFSVALVDAVGAGPTSSPKVLTPAGTPPGPVTSLAGTTASGSMTVTWGAPTSGGGKVTGYTATISPCSSGCTRTVPATTTTATFTGLTDGTGYSVAVAAKNAYGTGPSTSVSGTPGLPAPSAPTDVTATAGVTATAPDIRVTWHKPAANGATISGYLVTATPAGGGTAVTQTVTGPTATAATLTVGLAPGTTYQVTVAALYTTGTGPASSPPAVVTTVDVPGAPGDVVATSLTTGSGSIQVTWAPPAAHGSTVTTSTLSVHTTTGAVVTTVPVAAPATKATVTGATLVPGTTYFFTVDATNGYGTGPTSAPSNQATSITKPAKPATPIATANPDGTVSLTWSEPAGGTHGATITSYTVLPTPTCTTCTGTVVRGSPAGTSATIGGLVLGAHYRFRVTATNIAGTSTSSTASNTVTPATAPGAPTNVRAFATATSGTVAIFVTWTAPATNGSAITSYTVTATPAGGGTPVIRTFPGTSGAFFSTTGPTSIVPGTTYLVTVTATNAVGTGPSSSPAAVVTTDDVPGAPGDVVATSLVTGSGDVALTWSKPADSGSVIEFYTVIVHPATGAPAFFATGFGPTGATTTSFTVKGLTPGSAYFFTVNATNTVGTGPTSAPSNQATSITTPAAPTAPTAGANPDGTVGLTWSEPAGGTHGATITSYTVTPTPPCPTCTGLVVRGAPAGTSTVVGGLTLGQTYTFTVTATNIAGTSTASTASNTVTPATAPSAPTGVSAAASLTAGNAPQITVTWTAPADNGSALTGYLLSATPIGGGTSVTATAGPTATSGTITTGLAPGTAYTVTVTATNGIGTGPASSPPVQVTTFAPPGAPNSVVATSETTGSGSIQLTWAAPPDNGSAVTDYHVTATVVGGASLAPFDVGSAKTSYTVSGASLTPGDAYTFAVNATNTVGTGPTSAPSNRATSITRPAAPTTPTATANPDGTVSLTWTEPAGGTHGATITSYTVLPTPTCTTCTGTVVRGSPAGTSATIGGLVLGVHYRFRVTATNVAGTSAASTASNTVTPATAPTAPTHVAASAGITKTAPAITVTWTAATPKGSPITHSTVTVTPASGGAPVATVTVTATATTAVITTGLSPGTTYDVTVTATNATGSGPASSPAATVTTVDVPGAPGDVVATAGVDASATLTWAPPAANGLPITSYRVVPVPSCPSCTGLAVTGSPPAPTTTVTGLTVGTTYTFRVAAANGYGTGPTSAPSNGILAAGKPGAPTGVTAQPGDGTAAVTWSSPVDNGNPVTAYTVTATPTGCGPTCPATVVVGVTGNPPNTSVTVSGLRNHTTYDVTVTATNAAGTGPASSPAVPVVPAPEQGYWITTSSGGVYTYGGARYYGAAGAYRLNQPVVSMTATPDHKGYWQVAGDGGIFAFGDAGFYGSTGSMHLNQPVVGMAPTADGHGYWLVAADGGVFAFGDAGFHGSLPGLGIGVDDVVGIVPTADGGGYWMVGADGGVFAFGDAGFHGSLPGLGIAVHDIVDFVPTGDDGGYWMVGADGGVFAFGDAGYFGSLGGLSLGSPIAGLAATPSGNGYWLVAQDGYVFTEGDATYEGSPVGAISGQTVVAIVSSG